MTLQTTLEEALFIGYNKMLDVEEEVQNIIVKKEDAFFDSVSSPFTTVKVYDETEVINFVKNG